MLKIAIEPERSPLRTTVKVKEEIAFAQAQNYIVDGLSHAQYVELNPQTTFSLA
jgi:hypothetical protein